MVRPVNALAKQFQLAYVTRDLEHATAMLAEEYGVQGFVVSRFELALTTPPGTASVKVGIAWVDDQQIELIQPIGGNVQIYLSALPEERSGIAFHHIAMWVAGDIEDWERCRSAISNQKIALEGGREGMRFAYVDERANLGHYLEYVWMSERFLQQHPLFLPPARLPGRSHD